MRLPSAELPRSPSGGDLIVPPTGAARVALVMLHGLGMEPAVLHPFIDSLKLPAWTLIPTGPARTEMGLPAWWAVDAAKRAARIAAGASDLHDRHPEGRAAARASLAASLQGFTQRHPGLPLMIAGFSQGGMLAVDHAMLGGGPRVDALALFSSSCIALDEWRAAGPRLRGLPALVAHGREDQDLAFSAGERLRDHLGDAGAAVRWLPFEGGHQLPLVAWRALRRFVTDLADQHRMAA